MRQFYKYAIFLISVGIYTWFVGSYIGILLLLAATVIIASSFSSKWVFSIPILALVVGFVLLKYLTPSQSLSLPIGYSVFAFTCISYIVDISRADAKVPSKIIDVLCYLFFFPKMLAGPIVRFADMQKQFETCKAPSKMNLYTAFKILIYASFCKFVLADNLCIVTASESYGLNALLSTFLFAIQLYLDFYAYSNYAIAFALLVGIKLPESFNSPYRASTFREFWHRWNMTVSSWLKDYVYIPLGGNKCRSQLRVYTNIMLTFFVSGLWHGASFPFLLWGLLHGLFVITERLIIGKKGIENRFVKRFYRYCVLFVISLLWQLFKMDGLESCVRWAETLLIAAPVSIPVLWISIITILIVNFLDSKIAKQLVFSTSEKDLFVYKEVAFVCVMLFSVLLFHGQPNINFFYFKF